LNVFKDHPGINLVTGYKDWAVSNWDPSQTQKVLSSLLAKYPNITAVIDNSGGDASVAVFRTYEAANRPLVPLATFEGNVLACEYAKIKPKQSGLELATISGRNWTGRVAARKAIAAAQGLPENEPSIYKLPLFEDTLGGLAPQCDPKQAPDASLSAKLSLPKRTCANQGSLPHVPEKWKPVFRIGHAQTKDRYRMSRKSGNRFSEKDMRKD
jgi:ribose transport system substrate-binding protein